jgi:putative transposase
MIIAIGSRIPEVEIIEVNTDSDHVHILLSIPPRISISDVVKILKAKTSLSMRNKFPFLDKAEGGFWSRGYSVSTVGTSESTTSKYIQIQGKEDTVPDSS